MSTVVAPYVRVLRTPKAIAFVAAGFVGRLPLAMLGLATLLFVDDVRQSYGDAGAVGATLAAAMAVAGPRVGRLTDRYGQRRVLLPGLAVHACSVGALTAAVAVGAPLAPVFVAAALTGASFPSMGSLVRARWSVVLRDSPMLDTAYVMESILDDVAFTVGPVLATTLAVSVAPAAGLVVALGFTTIGGLALALQRETEPPVAPGDAGSPSAMRSPGLPPLVIVFVGVGAILGMVELGTVAFAGEHGARGLAGPLLGLFSLTSAAAGLVIGGRSWPIPPQRRLKLSVAALSACLVPLALVNSLTGLAVALAVAGCTLTPTIANGFSLVGSMVPGRAITEGFSWLSTALAGGVALGLLAGGHVVAAYGASAAYAVAACGAVAVTGLVAVGVRPGSTEHPLSKES